MIACTLIDIRSENDCPENATLADVKAKTIIQFQNTNEGKILIDRQEGIAVAAEGHVFNGVTHASIASEAFHRYMENGVDGILAMNGQYTVIVYDCNSHKLIALTDRLNTCSLFYEHPDCTTNRFSISNTLSWFKKTKEPPHLDLEYLVAYLAGYPKPAGRTPFKEVQRLPLATGLTFESRRHRLKQWEHWWPFPQKTPLPADICAHRLNEVMTEITHEFMTDYQESVGVFLSGGLDSAYVYAVAAHIGCRPPIAFHYSFQIPECNEREWAQAVVDHYGGELVFMDFGKLWIFQGFPDMPTTEEPLTWSFRSKGIIDHATTSRGIRLMLNGLGGDDFFDAPWDLIFPTQLTWRHPRRALKRLKNRVENEGHSYIDVIRPVLLKPQNMVPAVPDYLCFSPVIRDKPPTRFRGKTVVQKRMEMYLRIARPYVGVPSPYLHLSPLFDPRIIELAAALPSHMLSGKEITKLTLREAARSYLPDRVVNRKKENPHNPLLLQGLQREWPAIAHYFQQNARLYDAGLVDPDKFTTALQKCRGGNIALAALLVKALSCEAWLRKQ